MRIGLVIYGDLEPSSGGNLYDLKLVEALRRRGDEVVVLSLVRGSYFHCLVQSLTTPARLARRAAGLDLVLEDELAHPSLWRRRQQGGPLRVSVVHHLRASEAHPRPLRPLHRAIERAYLRGVDAFVCNSTSTRCAITALRGGGASSVVATPGGDRLGPPLSPVRVAERARAPGPLRLVFVGNLIARKGLDVLLDALAELTQGGVDCTLDVVGSGDVEPAYTRRIEQQVERARLGGRVRHHGRLDDRALAARLAASHLLVVPSSFEGFGIVYLEGFAFGLPAIATTAGGAGEIIVDGENGYLVAVSDAGVIVRRLRELAGDRGRLAELSLGALASFARHPTWEQTTASIVGYLDERARSARAPRSSAIAPG